MASSCSNTSCSCPPAKQHCPAPPARHCQFLAEITSTKSKVNQIYREKCFCVWFWKLFKSCKLWQVCGVNSITKRGSRKQRCYICYRLQLLIINGNNGSAEAAGWFNECVTVTARSGVPAVSFSAALLLFLEFVKSFMDIPICCNFCSIFSIFLVGKKKKLLDKESRSLSRSVTASWGIL